MHRASAGPARIVLDADILVSAAIAPGRPPGSELLRSVRYSVSFGWARSTLVTQTVRVDGSGQQKILPAEVNSCCHCWSVTPPIRLASSGGRSR